MHSMYSTVPADREKFARNNNNNNNNKNNNESRKKGGRGIVSMEDTFDATRHRLEDYIKRAKKETVQTT